MPTLLFLLAATSARADLPAIAWTEDFATDPVAAGRFTVNPADAADRFTYDAADSLLTAHYNTLEPTAWYLRPIDPAGGRTLGRYDDFEFSVTFRIRSVGFYADPYGFAQIAWGLINSQTTGPDRAGGSAGPYAFDCVTFDYFPNVSPDWGGPTLGPTIIHSDDGAGYFANLDFAFGAESSIDTTHGDETVQLDAVYTARVAYEGLRQIATLTISDGTRLLAINADGTGGLGGPDGDPTTIQTIVFIDNAIAVDSFALAAWQDTFSPYYASVIADVDVLHVAVEVPPVLLGDLNHDGLVDGRDIGPFVQALLSANPNAGELARGDFNGDGVLDLNDVEQFVNRLMQP